MNIKRNSGLTGIDMSIAVIAIIIFTTLIITLMSNNAIESVKIAKETMAMIYTTEIFENIGIADFDEVIVENKDIFIPEEVNKNYEVNLEIEDEFEDLEAQNMLKKINLTLKYEIGNKTYSCSAERLKAKE